ncbi:sodium/calcium exchanger 1a [Stigmatopora nigra]
MASIEVITSQERRVWLRGPDGQKRKATVRVWNETVSNLTLMALGSSAPEILLSVVEICGHGFRAGELGPNTIVGSAAFNMFVIIGLCVYVIPDGQSRRIKHPRVFFVTATWSVFAYAWLYLILAYFSPGVVEIWEGLLTLLFFPLCVAFAYVADRRLLFCKFVRKRYRAGGRGGVIVETEGEASPDGDRDSAAADVGEDGRTPGGGAAAAPGGGRPAAGVFAFEEDAVTVAENAGVLEVRVLRADGARGAVAVPYKTVEGSAKGGGRDFQDIRGVLEFHHNETCKVLRVNIIDDEEYEKNKDFWLEMGEPRLLEASGGKGEEPAEMAEMAEPTAPPALGQHATLRVVIQESYEFKSAVDKVLKKTRLAVLSGTTPWREQFREAVTVGAGGGGDDEDDDEKPPSAADYLLHFLTVFWKLLFALVPPTDYWKGWACFWVSIGVIGVLTALIGDLASHFGCTVGLKDSVTAVVFVALGTSVPDTFASKMAACQDRYADASVGNVTGSNAVNVFLGIGVAWSLAAVYHRSQDRPFRVEPGTLAFSVTLFTVLAFVCIAVLVYRRRPEIGGELGGPPRAKAATAAFFFSLWLIYVVLSSLEAYCHIQGF